MSIYGAKASSTDPATQQEPRTAPGYQYGLGSMNYSGHEPSLRRDPWYSQCSSLPLSDPNYMLVDQPGTSYNLHPVSGVAMIPQCMKQEPGIISDPIHNPNLRLPFVKQESSFHVSNTHPVGRLDEDHHNGHLHAQHLPDLGHPEENQQHLQQHHNQAALFTGFSPIHSSLQASDQFVQNLPFVKQEPGLNHNHLPGPDAGPNPGASGPLCVKQEPEFLLHIKEEPGTANSQQSFPDHSLTPFPSRPINFNFMADIEDIVPPSSSGMRYMMYGGTNKNMFHNFFITFFFKY